MRLTLVDILVPFVVAVVFVMLGFGSVRPIYAGRPLPAHMKTALLYGFFFVLGTGYLMMFGGELNWPSVVLFTTIGVWGVLLGSIAWRQHEKARAVPEMSSSRASMMLAESFTIVVLLISVIGSAVEWEYVLTGQGRWWIGLLWLAGVVASVMAVGHSRRTTVIIVLRGALGLLIMGAIAQRTASAILAAAAFGMALLLVEKFWQSTPNRKHRVLSNSTEHS